MSGDCRQTHISELPVENIMWEVTVTEDFEGMLHYKPTTQLFKCAKKTNMYKYVTGLCGTVLLFSADDSDEGDNAVLGVYRLVQVADTRGAAIAMSAKKPDEVGCEEHVTTTLEDAFLMPLSGLPRRPMWILFQDIEPFL